MSQFYDQASLVMIPSGVKDGKVYSQKPLSTDGQLTFSRGADIEATRVNSQGLIEKAKVNLLLQSNQFDTTWANAATTETGGQAGYDGTNDAWLITRSNAAAYIYQNIALSGVLTFSVYAKAGTLDWINLTFTGVTGVYFDIANGAVGNTGTAIAASIEAAGNGYYRCSMTISGTATGVRFFPAVGDNDVSGTTGNLYIQDSQVNYGLVAQEYQETTTAAVVTGITNDMPRLSYDPANPTCPSLLLEPSRLNKVKHSEYFDGWSNKSNCAFTSNYTVSPEGVQNASRLLFSSNGFAYDQSSQQSSATEYTLSCYAKRNDAGTQNVGFFVNGSGVVNSAWNLTSEWQRFTYTYTSTNTVYAGIAGIAGADISVYGFQMEAGSYASSMVPTYGTSATRTAEAANLNPSSLLGATQGSWFMELDDLTFEITGTSVPTAFIGSDVSNCLAIEGRASGQNKNIYFVKEQSGSVTTLTTKEISTTLKACFVWNGTSLKCFVDGVKAYDAGGFTQPSNWNVWSLNSTGREAQQFIKQEILFATALSDADAITLTT